MIRFFFFWLFFLAPHPAWSAYQRIVCLNPLVSEWVAEILGRDQALSRVVGVSEYSNYPEYLKDISLIGPYPKLQIERIASLKPDLVIGSEEYNLSEQVEQLRRLRLNVVILKKESFHFMDRWIESLGSILKEKKGSDRILRKWKDLRAELEKTRISTKRVFLEVQHSPLISVGGKSYLSEALETVGYQNIFSKIPSGYPKISMESVVKANPEVILILDHAGQLSELSSAKQDWGRFQNMAAVRLGHIYFISGDDFARCSLRLLIALKGLRSMHEDRNP